MVVGRELGRAIKSRRRYLGQTQPTAAEAIEALVRKRHPRAADEDVRVTATQVSDWENGKSLPHTLKFGGLAEWLDEPLRSVERMAEDAELPAGTRDEDVAELVQELIARLANIESEVQRLADENVTLRRENLEQQRDINRMLGAVLEALAKRL